MRLSNSGLRVVNTILVGVILLMGYHAIEFKQEVRDMEYGYRMDVHEKNDMLNESSKTIMDMKEELEALKGE